MNRPVPVSDALTALMRRRPANIPDLPDDYVFPDAHSETDEDRAERLAVKQRNAEARWLARLPLRFRDADLDTMELGIEPASEERIREWLDSGHLNLVMHGKAGHGKTHAAYAIGNRAVTEGLSVEAWTAKDLLHALRPEGDPTVEKASTCDLLILDDLGAERRTPWTGEQLHGVFDARSREKRRSIITTNLTGKQWLELYEAPLIDRMVDGAVIVEVQGEASKRKAAPF